MVAVDGVNLRDLQEAEGKGSKQGSRLPGRPYNPAADGDHDHTLGGKNDPAATQAMLRGDEVMARRNALAANFTVGGIGRRLAKILWSTNARKAATTGGSVAGVGGILGILMLVSFGSGPLEFIHIAKLLEGAHFGHLHLSADTRMGKMEYKVMATGDLGQFDAGNTRLGVIFNSPRHKAAIIKDLTSRGVEPEFGKLKSFKGFSVDTTNPKSPYYDPEYHADDPTAREALMDKMSKDMGLDRSFFSDGAAADGSWDGKIRIKPGFFSEPKAIRGMVALEGRGKLATWWRARTLSKYTLASNWHPLRKLDLKIHEKLTDALKEWVDQFKAQETTGAEPSVADSTKGTDRETDPKTGKPVDKPVSGGSNEPVTADGFKAKLLSLKGGISVAGGLAAAAGIICLFNALAKHIGVLQYFQVIVPMTRMATATIAVGNQIMSGQDVDLNEVGYLAQQFNTIDEKTHLTTSNWSDAAPIRAEMGRTGGQDINEGVKSAFNGVPDWLKWAESDVINGMCSEAAQLITGAVSIVVGIVSGGTVSTLIGIAIGAVAVPHILDFVAGILSGTAVNVSSTGAEWGNNIDYGSRLAANAEALQFGGTKLTDQQVAELNTDQAEQDMASFKSESLASRLFDVYDYRSFAGTMIDRLNLAGGPQALLAKIGSFPTYILGSLFEMPLSLLSTKVHAATPSYKYPFPEYGFSEQDMNNSLVSDPAANAKTVSSLLDNNNKGGEPDYITQALNCFGVAVAKGDDGWDAVPTTATAHLSSGDQDREFGVNAYDPEVYKPDDCIRSGDNNWLQIRFWIFDSAVAESYDCFLGDSTSCYNSGFN